MYDKVFVRHSASISKFEWFEQLCSNSAISAFIYICVQSPVQFLLGIAISTLSFSCVVDLCLVSNFLYQKCWAFRYFMHFLVLCLYLLVGDRIIFTFKNWKYIPKFTYLPGKKVFWKTCGSTHNSSYHEIENWTI